jgi:hypothetical protein
MHLHAALLFKFLNRPGAELDNVAVIIAEPDAALILGIGQETLRDDRAVA